nr:hypothetical protein Iba_chr13aCG4920 [Ipomoea batatas]
MSLRMVKCLMSPCMCIDKAVIFLGENAGLQTFLQIIHPAASNKLFFSTGKLRRRTLMVLYLSK